MAPAAGMGSNRDWRRMEVPHGPSGFGAKMLTAGVMALLMSAALREHWTVPDAPRVWWAWSYLVIFGSVIAFSAYRFLVKGVAPTLAATYAYVNPPVALAIGWWLGNENFSPNVLVALPVVLCSVALHTRIHTREHNPPSPVGRGHKACAALAGSNPVNGGAVVDAAAALAHVESSHL